MHGLLTSTASASLLPDVLPVLAPVPGCWAACRLPKCIALHPCPSRVHHPPPALCFVSLPYSCPFLKAFGVGLAIDAEVGAGWEQMEAGLAPSRQGAPSVLGEHKELEIYLQ